jgi:hypothetical protein
MTIQTKVRRSRVTKLDIARAREEILTQPKPEKQTIEKLDTEPRWGKDRYYGLVYCDSYGYAWIADLQLDTIPLGKTEEVIKVLKDRRVDAEDVAQVLQAIKEFRQEKKNQSYHLATKKGAVGVAGHGAKSHRITFKDSPQFLRLLDVLIKKGKGIPTIKRELKTKGYDVPYATLGRWIRKHRADGQTN